MSGVCQRLQSFLDLAVWVVIILEGPLNRRFGKEVAFRSPRIRRTVDAAPWAGVGFGQNRDDRDAGIGTDWI